MADTLESIYLNTAVGSTELNDGEHTILTTNSTTSYVLKDCLVNGTSAFTNTYLDLNGFNVGSLSSNLSGSLIIPPNSTLKIKTTDYPASFYEEKTMLGLNNNGSAVEKRFYNVNGDEVGTPILGYTGSSTADNTNIEDMDVGIVNNTKYVWYTATDGNSVQKLYVVDPAAENTSTTRSATTLANGTYAPFGFAYTSDYGNIALNFQSASVLGYYPLSTSPTGTTRTNPSYWGSSNTTISNSYLGTTSSYPLAFAGHDWFFYAPGTSYGTYFVGINLKTGVRVLWYLNTNWAFNYSTIGRFVVAYRPSDDKFVLYHWYNTTYVGVAVTKQTVTELNALTSNTNYSTGADSWSQEQLQGWVHSPKQSYYSNGVLGYDENGNVAYQDFSGYIRYQDSSGVEVPNSSVTSVTLSDGNTYTSDSRIFIRRKRKISAAEANLLGVTAPTFAIQITGIKSEV